MLRQVTLGVFGSFSLAPGSYFYRAEIEHDQIPFRKMVITP